MKTAYELAMERLKKDSPSKTVTAEQKRALAELDSKYAAKIAEREILVKEELDRAAAQGDAQGMAKIRQQWAQEREKLQAALEEKKEQIRQAR